ncbi:hypothetical protein GCM10023094_00260 [Rhodococcus olei]|uniref:Uncharacterized protein n=1 Tax=Rhodococcus olei TaxID=2161675 RepID=A0ABP8NST1_9NOCA
MGDDTECDAEYSDNATITLGHHPANRETLPMNLQPKTGRRRRFSVGARVRTPHSFDTQLPADQWPLASGVIVEEFTSLGAIGARSYGRDWAHPRRWAIALDDGNLICRDNEDLDDDLGDLGDDLDHE